MIILTFRKCSSLFTYKNDFRLGNTFLFKNHVLLFRYCLHVYGVEIENKYPHICHLEWNILRTYTTLLQHKKVLLIISLILLTKGNNSLNRLGDRHLYARNNTSILSKHKKIIDVHEAHVYAKSIESINNWRHSYILII